MVVGGIEGLRRALATRIEQATPQAQVAWENPWVQRETPLKKPVVAVSIDKVQTRRLGLGDFLGEGEQPINLPQGQQFGQGVTLGLRLDIYDRHSAESCYELFVHLCQTLMLEDFSPAPQSLQCAEAAFDRTAGAFHLTVRGELVGCLRTTQDAAGFDTFEIRRVTV